MERNFYDLMKHREIFDRAFERLVDLYGAKPHIHVLNRFYHEKMILQEGEYIRYLALIGKIRERADLLGEHIFVRGTAGSSLMAYLLDATDIDPLPPYRLCPVCKRMEFLPKATTPPDGGGKTCCGEEMIVDGYDLPFEMNLRSVFRENIQLGVSYAFFKEAKNMIYDEMWDNAIVTLRGDEDISLTWLCFFDRDENDDGEYPLKDNAQLFESVPHITLAPTKTLDKYRALEGATGVKMRDAYNGDRHQVFQAFLDGNIDGIPNIAAGFMKELIGLTQPRGYGEILKIIGLAFSSNVWTHNAERLFEERRMTLRDIPAFREDVYEMICEKLRERGMYETGFACDVTQKVRSGYYARKALDRMTLNALLDLGFDTDYIFLLEKINYMFPKAHAVAYLKDAITLMWYKLHDPETFESVFMKSPPRRSS